MASSSSSQPADAVSWSDLPGELLGVVASLLPSLFDLLRFRSVCHSWRAAAGATTCAPPSLPRLVFSEEGGADDASAHRCVYSLSDGKIDRVRLPEEARRWRCCGSSHGWLAMVGLDAVVRLLNPISGAQLELPPLTTLPQVLHVATGPETNVYYGNKTVLSRRTDLTHPWYLTYDSEMTALQWTAEEFRDRFVQKVVLASPPPVTPSDLAGWTVMMLYDDYTVAYARQGDEAWTSLWYFLCPQYEDLVPYQDKFYLLRSGCRVTAVDFAGAAGGPPRIEEDYSPRDESRSLESGARHYLSVAGPSGELILVRRYLRRRSGLMRTERFDVSRLEEDGGGGRRWVAAESLGGGALFLGNDCSTWVSCAPTGGCARDCIYFIADNMEYQFYGDVDAEGVLEVGVYHMNEEGVTETRLPPGQHPIWISPEENGIIM